MKKVRSRRLLSVTLLLLLTQAASTEVFFASTPTTPDRLPGNFTSTLYDSNPTVEEASLIFIENIGQFDPVVRFQVTDAESRLYWLTEDAIWITILDKSIDADQGMYPNRSIDQNDQLSTLQQVTSQGVHLLLSFVGVDPQASMVPFRPQRGSLNYLLGDSSTDWYTDVATWAGVRYIDLYPGIDLDVISINGQLTFEMRARSEIHLGDVKIRIEGSDDLRIDQDHILLQTAVGEIRVPLFRLESTNEIDLPQPSLEGDIISSPFTQLTVLEQEDPNRSGFAQQVNESPGSIHYATYLGGTGMQFGADVVVDSTGAAYVVGSTYSADFPTTPGAFQTSFGGGPQPSDAFVAKFNANGSDLFYATFLGGSNDDRGFGADVNSQGEVYVTGTTNSSDFPTTPGAYQEDNGGGSCGSGYPCMDAYITRLNADGTQAIYSTYLGGEENERSWGIAIDESGAAYVGGGTESEDNVGWVKKLSADGGSLAFTTVLDGSEDDTVTSVAVGAGGDVFATGYTASDDFPTTPGAFDTTFNGVEDVFVAKINPSSGALSYVTYLGGTGYDVEPFIDADSEGNAYVLGQTGSTDFPTTSGAFQTSYGGGSFDVFFSKLNADGSALVYSTYRGGIEHEFSDGIAVDGIGQAFLLYDLSGEIILEEMNTTGDHILVNVSLGGSDTDYGNAIAVGDSYAYVTGYTLSSDFPTTASAYQTSFGGDRDAFVAKIEVIGYIDHTIHTEEQGFDKCVHPNVSEMLTWRTYSNYHYIGIYIGDQKGSRYCDQPDLNASWIDAVASQGWGFIPIWVGPQAPRWANPGAPEEDLRVCANGDYEHKINLDPEIARDQGIQEARDAIEMAYQLGLVDETKSGTIIYYDLERFEPGEPECDAAVNAFVDGWVSELERLGNKGGTYSHAINVDEWYSLDSKPDAVWFASYLGQQCPDPMKGSYCYDPDIRVDNIPSLPNDHWQHERLRQYTDSHTESYGDIEFTIDSDAADGIVAIPVSVSTSSYASIQPSNSLSSTLTNSGLEFTIQDMDFLTQEQGWALVNNRLRWTSNGGDDWVDVTPSAGAIIESVFFLNTSEGWVMSAEVDEGGQVSGLYMSHTSDGGQTWQTSSFNALDPVEGYSAVYLDFVDSQSGWVVVRLPSSSNYSFGELFRTVDGGATWSPLDIPLGEPINFITTLVGWVAGGPAGDQLYMTRDGGTSWDQQNVASKAPGGGYLVYHLPTFQNSLEGILPVVVNDLPDTSVEFYSTSDGGLTWLPLDTTTLDREIRPGTTFPIAVTESGEWRLPIPASLPGIPSGVTALDFISEDVGWAYTTNNVCVIQGGGATACPPQSQLLRTMDGGQTWSDNIFPGSYLYLPLIYK
jgi:photosystem II stability/assembly factor-like uncharacterized protein